MEKDLRKKKYLYDTERFADLINGTVCHGKQIISANDLSDMDSQTGNKYSEESPKAERVIKCRVSFRFY